MQTVKENKPDKKEDIYHEEDQKIFVRLLDESDLNLFRWLLKGETPATDEFKHIINIMIDAYNSKHSEL